jgi:hypothetical protein
LASLLLHEGALGGLRGAPMRTTYGHVIDELDKQPRVPVEDAIKAAR